MKKVRRDILPFVLFLSGIVIIVMLSIRYLINNYTPSVQNDYKKEYNYFEKKNSKVSAMRSFLDKQMNTAKLSQEFIRNNSEDESIKNKLPSDDPNYISRNLPVWQSNIDIYSNYNDNNTDTKYTVNNIAQIINIIEPEDTKFEDTKKHVNSSTARLPMDTIIHCVLKNSVYSDIPSTVSAQVSHDVYSDDGETIAIPHGSILWGEYNSQIQLSQKRIVILFHHAILPNGTIYPMDSALARESDGSAGVISQVDNHLFDRFTHAILSASVSYALENLPEPPWEVSGYSSQKEISRVVAQTSAPIIDTHKNIQPTLFVAAGKAIQVMINQIKSD